MRIQSLSAREDELFPYIYMDLFQLTRSYYLYAVEYRRSWKTCLASRLRERLEEEKGKRSNVVSPFYSSHLPPRASPTRRLPSLIVSLRNRTVERRERRGRQKACGRPITYVFLWWSSLKLTFSGLVQNDLFKGGWSSAEKFFKQNYCHACHTRFAVSFLSRPVAQAH